MRGAVIWENINHIVPLWLLSIGGPLTQRTGIMLGQMRQETNYLLTMTVFKK